MCGTRGISFATPLDVLHIDQCAPCTPRLPSRRRGALAQLVASATLHLIAVLLTIASLVPVGIGIPAPAPALNVVRDVAHIVFVTPDRAPISAGGGGGGNQQAAPIRRAQASGADTLTLQTRRSPPAAAIAAAAPPAVLERVSQPAALVLDARPLASGTVFETGLPTTSDEAEGTSSGPGSGGGTGTGIGTGVGPGRGPGIGPGSGGGTGGGAYRPGGAVTAPRVIRQVEPTYSPDALQHRIQGSVLLEVVVTRDGFASNIRVVRSLDPYGLDQQAVAAVAQWRFEPGRLADTPVDVLVTIIIDFWIR